MPTILLRIVDSLRRDLQMNDRSPKRKPRPGKRLLDEYVAATLRGDGEEAGRVIDLAVSKLPSTRDVYLEVLIPAQQAYGELWETRHIGVAEEHCATQITIEQLHRLRSRVARRKSLPFRAVLAALEGESHFLGARIFADFLYEDGWTVDFLGGNTPVPALTEYIARRAPNLVALTLTVPDSVGRAIELVGNFASRTSRPKILLGGRAAVDAAAAFDGLPVDAVASDLRDGLRRVNGFFDHAPLAVDVDEILGHFGRVLTEQRKAKNLSQTELAALAGLDRAYLSAIEKGRQNISLAALVRLSNALELPLRTFFPTDR